MAWIEIFTAGLLPAKLRTQFGLRWGPLERVLFRRSIPVLRAARRASPKRLRYYPAYIEATRRLDGHQGPDRIGRWLERVALRGLAR